MANEKDEKYLNPFSDFDFKKVFDEIANFTDKERKAYQENIKYYRDLKNSIDKSFEDGMLTGFERGFEKGIEQGIAKGIEQGLGKYEMVKIMFLENESVEKIVRYTGLTKEQIENIINSL